MIKILQRENSGYISKHRNIVPKKSLGNGLKLFLLSFTLLLFSFTASASHFRYGNISWTRISETSTTSTIQLNVSTSWRLGAAPGSIYFAFSGGPTSGGVSIPTTVTIDPSGGWSNAVGSQVITLQKSSTPYLIAFNGGNKIGGLQNNNGGYWNVFTIVNTNAPGSSPVSTLPAVINMPVGVAAATYTIPASDPDANATLSYRFATPSEMAGAYAAYSPVTQPSGLSINPTTGQLTFNTVGKSPGQLYNAGVVVTDNDGNQIFLDFLINITNFSNPPVFDYTTTPANGTTFNVIVGQNLSFPIKATDTDAGSTVSLSASGLPNYITTSNFSPAFPATGNPSQTTFSYTPGVAQIGSTIVLNFIATDNVGVQSSTSVTVKVVAEPAPTFTAQTLAQNSITQIQTGVPFSTNIEAVSSLGSNVSIGFSTGVPASASLSPTIPTAGANPGLTQLSWTPQPSDFGQKNLSFTAQITNIPTIFAVRNFSLIVNTPPVFTSIPPVTEVLFNTPFTYNITTSDLDIPYGDVVKIETLGLPSWLTLTSTGNGTATLSGTPSITDGGTYHIKLEAADTYHHGNPTAVIQEFDLKVTVCNTDLTSTTVKTSCPSSADGSIDLSVSGGKAPFTFAWSNGSTTEDISGLAAGNYSVTVTDANSCIATSTITIIAGIDSTAPVAPLLADVTGQCSVTVTNTPTTTDNCAGIINGTTTSPLTFAAQGNYVIVWKFDDGNGNITTANQNVIVKDDTKPVFVTVNNVSVSTSPTTNNALVTVPTPIVTDNCEKPTGNSLAFDGVDDIVAVSQGLPSMTEMTIETWLKPKELSNWDVIMNYNTFNIGDVHFQFFPNKTLEFSVAGNNPTDQFTTATFDDEKWYHFAAVYSSVGKYVKFYLNGNLIDTRTYTSAIATAANKAFSIGGWAPGNRYFNGNLDDLRIWNVARTAEQIKVSMNSTLQGNEIGLLAYYDFNQGIAGGNNSGVTSVTDLAGGNNSGVLQNFALNGNISNWVNGAPTTGINLVNDFNNSSDASGTYQAGSTIVNWTATDAAGNKASTQQTVTVIDSVKPIVITKNITVQLNASGNVGITPVQVNNGTTDNSGNFTLSLDKANFDCSNLGANLVTLTATDANGNTSTNTNPSGLIGLWDFKNANPLKDQTGNWGDLLVTGNASISNGKLDVNNGGMARTTSYTGATIGNKTLISYLSLDDLNLRAGSALTIDKINSDAFDGIIYAEGQPNRWMNGSSNALRYQALNPGFAESKANQLIQVALTYEMQPNNQVLIKFYRNGIAYGSYTSNNFQTWSANDAEMIFGARHFFNNTQIGSLDAKIEKAMIFNRALSIQEIQQLNTIVTVEDKIAPIIASKPISVTLTASGTVNITPQDVLLSGTDNCSGTITYTLSRSTFGATDAINSPVTVQLTGTDVSGNATSVPVLVTVIDPVPVVLTKNITVALGTNGSLTITPQQIDNGSSSVVGLATEGGLVLDKTTFDCSNIGVNTVKLTVTSSLGSTAFATAIVTVIDTIKPIVLTQNKTIQLNAAGAASITAADIDNGSTDNCKIATVVLSKTAFDCSNVGANTATLTVTDVNGNVSTKDAVITVEDKVAPTVFTQNRTIQLNGSGNATITAADINNGSTDNCGIATVVLSKTSFDCSNYGANTVTLTVTDIHGNVSTKTATVTVEDNVSPIVLTQNKTIQLNGSGQATITAADINNGSTDNCAIATVTLSKTSFDCSNYGAN
nr:hypothetical protein [Pseudopedobacter sp.]